MIEDAGELLNIIGVDLEKLIIDFMYCDFLHDKFEDSVGIFIPFTGGGSWSPIETTEYVCTELVSVMSLK